MQALSGTRYETMNYPVQETLHLGFHLKTLVTCCTVWWLDVTICRLIHLALCSVAYTTGSNQEAFDFGTWRLSGIHQTRSWDGHTQAVLTPVSFHFGDVNVSRCARQCAHTRSEGFCVSYILLFLPFARQPAVGFGLPNNIPPFFSICRQLSPSPHS